MLFCNLYMCEDKITIPILNRDNICLWRKWLRRKVNAEMHIGLQEKMNLMDNSLSKWWFISYDSLKVMNHKLFVIDSKRHLVVEVDWFVLVDTFFAWHFPRRQFLAKKWLHRCWWRMLETDSGDRQRKRHQHYGKGAYLESQKLFPSGHIIHVKCL